MRKRKEVQGALKEAVAARRKAGPLPESESEARAVLAETLPAIRPGFTPLTEETLEPLMAGFFDCIRAGESVASFAKRVKLPASALRKYAWNRHRDDYEAARREGADAFAERSVDIAAGREEAVETVTTTYQDGSQVSAEKRFDNVQRSKLASDALWRMAIARDPARYSGKGQDTASASMMQELAAARRRVSQEKAGG